MPKSEISNFEQLINNVEKTVDSISKARKKPSGWTADKTKLMIKKFELWMSPYRIFYENEHLYLAVKYF